MQRHDHDQAAVALGLLAVLFWSTVATAFKFALRRVDTFQLLLYATATACVCLYLILLAQGRQREPWALRRADYLRCMALGMLNPLCYYLVLFRAYALLPAQIAQALNYTWVIALSLLSVPLLHQRLRAVDLAAALICYAGAAVVCLGGAAARPGAMDATGVLLALGSTVIWSLYWIGKTRDPLEPVVGLFLSFLSSLPVVAAACAIASRPLDVDRWGLLGAVYVGVFEMGVTYVIWLKALRRARSAARVSTLIFLSPFVSLLFIRFVLGEPIAPATVPGLGLIAGGLAWQRLPRRAAVAAEG